VHNLDQKSESEDSFNKSDEDDQEEDDGDQLADAGKITTSKLSPRVTAPHGFGHMPPITTKKMKLPRPGAMHQTYGGMQPWHEMKKKHKARSQDSDDGIFSRHQKNVVVSEMNSSHMSNFGPPAVLDGRILLLDAKEALQSINGNDDSSVQAS